MEKLTDTIRHRSEYNPFSIGEGHLSQKNFQTQDVNVSIHTPYLYSCNRITRSLEVFYFLVPGVGKFQSVWSDYRTLPRSFPVTTSVYLWIMFPSPDPTIEVVLWSQTHNLRLKIKTRVKHRVRSSRENGVYTTLSPVKLPCHQLLFHIHLFPDLNPWGCTTSSPLTRPYKCSIFTNPCIGGHTLIVFFVTF